jgi:hypothetical protein
MIKILRTGMAAAAAVLLLSTGGCAAGAAEDYSNDMKITPTVELDPTAGADLNERSADHADSPYYKHPDFYHMKSSGSLTILSGFQTYQQTSDWSCGVASSLMVLNWYGKLGSWNEKTLAALRHPLDEGSCGDYPGTSLKQAMDIFNGVGGFTMITTFDRPDGFTIPQMQEWLSQGKPIMICWNSWGGHWQVIIGLDTMGTESEDDDVMIIADPYDTTDHDQDGYITYSAERFLAEFTMSPTFSEAEGGNDHLFLVATPNS